MQGCCHGDHAAAVQPPVRDDVAIDPVCGMKVVKATAKHSAVHDGATYYFCNPRCREKFIADPEGVLARAAERAGSQSRNAAQGHGAHAAHAAGAHSHGRHGAHHQGGKQVKRIFNAAWVKQH